MCKIDEKSRKLKNPIANEKIMCYNIIRIFISQHILLYTIFFHLSRAKEVFFYLKQKIFRVIGYIFCALLLILCILLIIAAAAFGSRKTVNAFGFNLYIVETDGIQSAPKGSAVIVSKTTAFDLREGKLVLYAKADNSDECALGYVQNVYVVDGIYYLTLSDGTMSAEVPESRLVGLADYASVPLGYIIEFIKTPFGVFCVAFLPCIALILYDIIRAAAARLPDPEVEPQLKNHSDEERISPVNIKVKSDGKAAYSRRAAEKPSAANDVLFDYNRPIIPLTDRTEKKERLAKTDMPVSERVDTVKRTNPGAISRNEPKTPENIGVSRYISNSESIGSDKTNELPKLAKKEARDNGDAFFAQTTVSSLVNSKNAPQIGRQRRQDETEETVSRPAKTAGRRSSQIIASKRVEDLISDDDDIRDRNRIHDNPVDDIISGLKK